MASPVLRKEINLIRERIGLDLSGRLMDFSRMRFLSVSCIGVALLVGCGSGEAPSTEPAAGTQPEVTTPATPAPEVQPTPPPPAPTPAVQTETTPPAVEVAEPAESVTPQPAEPSPPPAEAVAKVNEPVAPLEPAEPEIKLSEDIVKPAAAPPEPMSTPSIRSALRERFVEEHHLVLKENRWHFPGEEEPYTGLAKRWSVDGWKQAEGNYRNGLQDGRWKMWWDNGLLRSAVLMKNGNAEGEAKYWYKNGQFEKEGNWIKGKFVATAKWNEAGESIPVE